MPRLAWSWAVPLLAASAASAAPPAQPLDLSLASTEQQLCAAVVAPQPWRDASDAFFFATGSTARLDQHELWAGVLAPLLSMRVAAGTPHFFVLGTPVQTALRFTPSGWRPRWPAC
jgi:hypothetical protein